VLSHQGKDWHASLLFVQQLLFGFVALCPHLSVSTRLLLLLVGIVLLVGAWPVVSRVSQPRLLRTLGCLLCQLPLESGFLDSLDLSLDK